MRPYIRLKLYEPNLTRKIALNKEYWEHFGYDSTEINTNEEGWIVGPEFNERKNKIYVLGDSWIEN